MTVQPPEMPGVVWVHKLCPSCGNDWWLGRDTADDTMSVDDALWDELLPTCADCRERATGTASIDGVYPNRAARRLARRRR